jgi:hypothetical protein
LFCRFGLASPRSGLGGELICAGTGAMRLD